MLTTVVRCQIYPLVGEALGDVDSGQCVLTRLHNRQAFAVRQHALANLEWPRGNGRLSLHYVSIENSVQGRRLTKRRTILHDHLKALRL